MLKDLFHDARLYHSLRFPGKVPNCLSLTFVVIRSRGLLVLAAHRAAYASLETKTAGPQRWVGVAAVNLLQYLAKAVAKSSISPRTRFEAPVVLSDLGHIILGARLIGAGTMIHDRVTLGKNLINKGIPEIGRRVWIGHHCIVSGNITVGDGVTILPWTVLTKSLPPNVVVYGNPARIVRRDFDNSEIRSATDRDPECLAAPERL